MKHLINVNGNFDLILVKYNKYNDLLNVQCAVTRVQDEPRAQAGYLARTHLCIIRMIDE